MSEGERAVTGLSGEEREALRRGWLEDLEANDMWGAGGAGIDGIEEAVARIVAERTRAAVERAADVVHSEARWCHEMAMRGQPQDAVDRMLVAERAIRAALDDPSPAERRSDAPWPRDTFRPGVDSYDDTPGGHADRHTLVIEAAERALREGRP